MSDYISRDELLELYSPDPECDKCSVPFPVVRQNILDMPAADVAPVRHGKWIGSEMNFGYCDIIQKEYIAKKYICSECGYETGDQAKKFVCCPICMARMDKEDEHETG